MKLFFFQSRLSVEYLSFMRVSLSYLLRLTEKKKLFCYLSISGKGNLFIMHFDLHPFFKV